MVNVADKSPFTSSEASAMSLRMGCKDIQATDKFGTSVDTDAWCNSTGQNPYFLIWERSRISVANAGCKRTLNLQRNFFPRFEFKFILFNFIWSITVIIETPSKLSGVFRAGTIGVMRFAYWTNPPVIVVYSVLKSRVALSQFRIYWPDDLLIFQSFEQNDSQ